MNAYIEIFRFYFCLFILVYKNGVWTNLTAKECLGPSWELPLYMDKDCTLGIVVPLLWFIGALPGQNCWLPPSFGNLHGDFCYHERCSSERRHLGQWWFIGMYGTCSSKNSPSTPEGNSHRFYVLGICWVTLNKNSQRVSHVYCLLDGLWLLEGALLVRMKNSSLN